MPNRHAIVTRAAHYADTHYLAGQGYDQRNIFSDLLEHPAEAWCGDFVSAIYAMTKLSLPSMQDHVATGFAYVPSGWAYAGDHAARKSSWEARPGDVVCFDWTGAGTCVSPRSHTGIVERWAGGTLHTIEGNSAPHGGVNRHEWPTPQGTGNDLIAGVIDTGKLVRFGASTTPDEPATTAPPFPGRTLMLKTPLMTGDDVRAWQRRMKNRGWHIDANGSYDAHTADVCKQFQKQKGVPPSGQVGARTRTLAWTAPVSPE